MLPLEKSNRDFDSKAETPLADADYAIIQDFLNRNSGILLSSNKQYLVINRLASLFGRFDIRSFAELATALQSTLPSSTKLKNAVIDAMTTNETFWFRDERQFAELKDTLFPALFTQKNGTLKIWSAACSSGQEPYSIGITALDAMLNTHKHKVIQIVGTDISETVLDEAKNAVYSELSLTRGVDPATKARYFEKTYDGYRLKSEVTQLVGFQQFNLLKPFAALGRFDIIFCRNVLIYFSETVKLDILNRMRDCLEPGGYLFLSSTEAMPSEIQGFETVNAGLTCYYRKSDSR